MSDASSPITPKSPAPATPAEAEARFYAAFESLDLNVMRAVWDARAICVHPGGPLLNGLDAVLQSWSEIFASADPPRIDYTLILATTSADLAVHLVEERIHANGKASAKPATVLATNTYVRVDGGWKLLAHHASLPLMGKNPGRDPAHLH